MRRTVAGLAVLGLALAGCGTGRDSGGPEPSGTADGRASGPRWAYDEVLDRDLSLSDVVATSADDVWVTGAARDGKEPSPDDVFLLRRDGARWERRPMPEELGDHLYGARLDPIGSGAEGFLLTASRPGSKTARTVRWDGSRWTALPEIPGGTQPLDVEAFGADDVWVLGLDSRTHHWDGSRWTTSVLPATAVALDGAAPDDLWAVGHRSTAGAGDGGELTQPAALHWDGRSWQQVGTPEYRFPEPVPAEPGASLDQVVVLAADDVRAYGTHTFNHGEGDDEPAEEAVRLRWDGSRWERTPDAEGECAGRAPVALDGGRGFVLAGNRYLAADGACTRITRPRLPGGDGVRPTSRQSLWLSAVEPVPGTGQVLGVGHVQVNQSGDPMDKPVVVSLRR
ncbi:hypothetical protein [Streptomyces fructofermentans]|uniref:hypothetical protein n=1 Tax=Streptomyces fructofermentans TaxID=152141 RepID=UPI0037B2D672